MKHQEAIGMIYPFKYDCNEKGKYPEKVQILRIGKWKHPIYGDFAIKNNDLILFKENFDKDVYKTKLALDAEHFPEKGAAAWFTELEIVGRKLYAHIEWTEWGMEIIDKKLFRYISPEFAFEYEDKESGDRFHNVLFGAALTNRPFLKGMEPVLMNENKKILLCEEKGGDTMELKEFLAVLGLKEEATIEDVKIKIAEMGESTIKKLSEELGVTSEKIAMKFKEMSVEIGNLKKSKEGKVELSETEVKELKEDAKAGKKASEDLHLKEANDAVSKALTDKKIVPAQKDWAVKYALSDIKGFEKFIEAAPEVISTNEKGSEGEGRVNKTTDEIHKLTEERVEKKKISYGAALKEIIVENKELADKYTKGE